MVVCREKLQSQTVLMAKGRTGGEGEEQSHEETT